MDQITAWKDSEARDGETADHPSGSVELPMSRGQVARATALAGLVVAFGVISQFGAGTPGTTTAP